LIHPKTTRPDGWAQRVTGKELVATAEQVERGFQRLVVKIQKEDRRISIEAL